jgi:hypothetical protein
MGPGIREGTYIDEAVYDAARYLTKASNPNSRRIIVKVSPEVERREGEVTIVARKGYYAAGQD